MRWMSMLAIYILFWVLSAFIVLPFGVRTHSDVEAEGNDSGMVPGQAHSAPVEFRPGRIAKRATIVSLVLFGLFYANYVEGWITASDIDVMQFAPPIDSR